MTNSNTAEDCSKYSPDDFRVPEHLAGGDKLVTVTIRRSIYDRLGLDKKRVFVAQTKPGTKTADDVQDNLIVVAVQPIDFAAGRGGSLEEIHVGHRGIRPKDKVMFKPENLLQHGWGGLMNWIGRICKSRWEKRNSNGQQAEAEM